MEAIEEQRQSTDSTGRIQAAASGLFLNCHTGYSFKYGTLPPEQLLKRGQFRPLARAALADRVPKAILDSRLRGMQSADWYLQFRQSDALQVLEEIEPHPAVRELFDTLRIRRAIQSWPDRDFNSGTNAANYRIELMNALATGIFIVQN